ncbi:hypothetical protein B0H16DRAFT_564951 [Mycena metata]|uniref:RRM domain-containing protein n=1 Tax=Mycena metata TaxID=1033252 RepID=A0AAD7H4Y4_9AGAR|nr:hypothetical protein B0H16DRAFT_564951 [Mycena metata]
MQHHPHGAQSTYPHLAASNNTSSSMNTHGAGTTLLWTSLEPWMDAEYARQVCALLRWDAGVWVPPNPPSNHLATGGGGSGANNPGYAVLTFSSREGAERAVAMVNPPTSGGPPMTMPNSARAFVLGWAPAGVVVPLSSNSANNANASYNSNNSNNSNLITNANNASGGGVNAGAYPNAYPTNATANANGPGVLSPTSPLSPTTMHGGGGGGGGGGGVYASMHAPASPPSSAIGSMGAVGGVGANGIVGMTMNNGVNGICVGGGVGVGVGVSAGGSGGGGNPQYPKEYSIFVGDLAPETSNSDLVAVFRNPVLGLRNDRAPKFIRPFVSCKSAKIMLDPVTGVSRGYGFVRFTDEGDQQRALIEMHGLYCLSRPMRISPATAKYKPPQPDAGASTLPASTSTASYASTGSSTTASSSSSYASVSSIPSSVSGLDQLGQQQAQAQQAPSVTTAIVGPYYAGGSGNGTPVGASVGGGGQEYFAQYPGQAPPQPQQQQPQAQQPQQPGQPQQDPTAAEWRHHAQARAILGNLIGPNGEQLTSTDPYNTTVFVGGLSPLVGEDTLRTFFVPFGEIHYVKVPVGKHCGFVQFVRKADAEQAIEKMQGFPVGGSRIRLSWGRSQYKAAQAAAQAAQVAALQAAAAPSPPVPAPLPVVVPQQQQPQQPQVQPATAAANGNNNVNLTPAMLGGMTQEQVVMLLQRFGLQPGVYGGFPAPLPPQQQQQQPVQHQQQQQQAIPNGGYAHVASGNVNGSGSGNGAGYGGAGSSSSGSSNGGEMYRNGYSSSPSNSTVGDAYMTGGNGGAPQPPYTEEGLKVRRDDAGPFGYPQQRGGYELVLAVLARPQPAAARAAAATAPAPAAPDAPPAPAAGAVRGGGALREAPRVVLGAVAVPVCRGPAAPEQGVRAGLLSCAALAADARGDWDGERRRGQGKPDPRGTVEAGLRGVRRRSR